MTKLLILPHAGQRSKVINVVQDVILFMKTILVSGELKIMNGVELIVLVHPMRLKMNVSLLY